MEWNSFPFNLKLNWIEFYRQQVSIQIKCKKERNSKKNTLIIIITKHDKCKASEQKIVACLRVLVNSIWFFGVERWMYVNVVCIFLSVY